MLGSGSLMLMGEDLPEEGEESRELQSGTVDNFLGATSWEWVPSFVSRRGLRWGWGQQRGLG